ncbi:hypothetical protein NQ318_019638 [Aromia moschata]|uniref:Uncharacterized protein n=1 Tax=Aromia moschata TaxID=1265417 RepID=A0AAV8Z6M0_9CUCU|nr:hypothetical protein NQ318_019638 [Aromia moschata]
MGLVKSWVQSEGCDVLARLFPGPRRPSRHLFPGRQYYLGLCGIPLVEIQIPGQAESVGLIVCQQPDAGGGVSCLLGRKNMPDSIQ